MNLDGRSWKDSPPHSHLKVKISSVLVCVSKSSIIQLVAISVLMTISPVPHTNTLWEDWCYNIVHGGRTSGQSRMYSCSLFKEEYRCKYNKTYSKRKAISLNYFILKHSWIIMIKVCWTAKQRIRILERKINTINK